MHRNVQTISHLVRRKASKINDALTLSSLRAGLKERGVEIGLSTLSELIALGDISQQLGVQGDGGKRIIHADVLDILAAFLPAFADAKATRGLTNKSAPDFLRGFLDQRNSISDVRNQLVPASSLPVLAALETAKQVDSALVAEIQGRAQGLAMTEKVLAAAEAAEVLGITKPMLRKTVPAWKRFGKSAQGDRWLLSDLLRKE